MQVDLRQTHLFGTTAPKRIAVVRALPGLGDLLCLVPALRSLRTGFPESKISLIGLPWARTFVQRFHLYCDEWLEFPGFPGIPEVPLIPQKVVAGMAQLQQHAFDLALQLHGNGSAINSFVLLLNAKQTVCFAPPGAGLAFGHKVNHSANTTPPNAKPLPTHPPIHLSTLFYPYPDQEHEIHRNLRLLEHLGLPLQGTDLEFPLTQTDWDEFAAIAHHHSLPQTYICIHPGASVPDRRYPPELFAAIADALAQQGFPIILTGTPPEAPLTQSVRAAMNHSAIDLTGQTSLGSMAALLKRSRLLISNDTGVSHLATALQTPSVILFSNSDPHRWAPLNGDRHRIIFPSPPPPPPPNPPLPQILTAALHFLHSPPLTHAT